MEWLRLPCILSPSPRPMQPQGFSGKRVAGAALKNPRQFPVVHPFVRPGVLGEAFLGWNGGGENERKRIRRNRGGPLGVRMTGGLNREQGFMKF